jgi:ureidoglycolate lyase
VSRTLQAEPLTAAAFAPFGAVIGLREGRTGFAAELCNRREAAQPHLSIATVPAQAMPLAVRVMERHAFSSQSFVPIDVARYLVLVAPAAPAGGPDMAAARAFIADGDQAITYGVDVWHHPLTVLDRAGRFTVLTWRDGTAGDEEFRDVAETLQVALPAGA